MSSFEWDGWPRDFEGDRNHRKSLKTTPLSLLSTSQRPPPAQHGDGNNKHIARVVRFR